MLPKHLKGITHAPRCVCTAKRSFSSTQELLPSKVHDKYVPNPKQIIEKVGQSLGVKAPDDWYQVTRNDFCAHGGRPLLAHFPSFIDALRKAYPEHDFQFWKFNRVPKGWWEDIEHQREWFTQIGQQIGVKKMEDWYKVRVEDLEKLGGLTLLKQYDQSPLATLRKVYPDFKWLPWKFEKTPSNYWKDKENHRLFLDWFASQYNITKPQDWYNIKLEDIEREGGSSLLKKYQRSIYLALSTVYPEHEFKAWKFARIPKGFWSQPAHIREMMSDISEQLHIGKLEDWYRVTWQQLVELGAAQIIRRFGTIHGMLQFVYPDYEWDLVKFSVQQKKTQKWLQLMTEQIFPKTEILVDHFHPDLLFSQTKVKMQLDIFLPAYSIAFEYQGEQHFHDIHNFSPQRQYALRDNEKRIACADHNITLIEIPYWWDRSKNSLVATILHRRPELKSVLAHDGQPGTPIPETVPSNFYSVWKGRERRTKMFELPSSWNSDVMDPKGWWISTKLGGVRVQWDGQKLFTSNGKPIKAPSSFTESLPSGRYLDGELWMEGKSYNELLKAIRSQEGNWNGVTFYVCDIPKLEASFEERVQVLKELENTKPQLKIAKYILCEGREHLKEELKNIEESGNEGLWLRRPRSTYAPGNDSENLYLVKNSQEALVRFVKETPQGLMCRQMNGLQCIVSLPPHLQEVQPLKEGAVLAVYYQGTYRSGRYRSPLLWRVRSDLAWEHAVHKSKSSERSYADLRI